jgi:2-phospho-L-lactate guanylyltransferase
MSLWAIVPVKPLRRGKSRLAGVLSEDQREALNRRMLINTVEILNQVKDIEYVLVISRDPLALSVARECGARTLLENGHPELNGALTRAAMLAGTYRVHGVLIVPADLPLLNVEDVQDMAVEGRKTPRVVIAPDRRKEGTNALLLTPPDIIEFDYGPGSYARHVRRAQEAGAEILVFERDSLALDMDYPEDLKLLEESLRIDIGLGFPV